MLTYPLTLAGSGDVDLNTIHDGDAMTVAQSEFDPSLDDLG
jgi:hypothetical protein